jgi:hypothetical protein
LWYSGIDRFFPKSTIALLVSCGSIEPDGGGSQLRLSRLLPDDARDRAIV